jgi:hypothetical protein
MLNRVQTVLAGLLLSLGTAGFVYFATATADGFTDRPALYLLIALAGAALFASNRPA